MMKKAENLQSIQSDLAMQLTPEPDQSSDTQPSEPQLDMDELSLQDSFSEEVAERDPSNDLIDEMDDDFEFEFGDESAGSLSAGIDACLASSERELRRWSTVLPCSKFPLSLTP